MTRRTPIWRRYATFFGRNIRSDIEDEIKFHVEARARELVDDGWPPRAAEEEAQRLFGDRDSILTECQQIDTRFEQRRKMLAYLADIAADVRYALRGFKRTTRAHDHHRAHARGRPRRDGGDLQRRERRPAAAAAVRRARAARANRRERAAPARAFGGVAQRRTAMSVAISTGGERTRDAVAHRDVMRREGRTLATPDGSVQIYGQRVSPALFAMRGVQPLLGRGLVADDERPDADVVVLGEAMWREYFDAAPDIVGRRIELDCRDLLTVVGVMPPRVRRRGVLDAVRRRGDRQDPYLWRARRRGSPTAFRSRRRAPKPTRSACSCAASQPSPAPSRAFEVVRAARRAHGARRAGAARARRRRRRRARDRLHERRESAARARHAAAAGDCDSPLARRDARAHRRGRSSRRASCWPRSPGLVAIAFAFAGVGLLEVHGDGVRQSAALRVGAAVLAAPR